jgi:hypothetical protein
VNVVAPAAVPIPTAAHVRLRSTSIGGATLLLFAAHPVSADFSRPFRLEGGARSTYLWSGLAPFALLDGARLQVGRIAFAGNMEITLADASEMEIVAAITVGSPEVTIGDGTMAQRNEKYVVVPVAPPRVLMPGEALQISRASRADLGTPSGASADIWLVAIGPVEPERAGATPVPGRPGRRR